MYFLNWSPLFTLACVWLIKKNNTLIRTYDKLETPGECRVKRLMEVFRLGGFGVSCFVLVGGEASLCSHGCPGTHSLNQDSLQLTELRLSLPTEWCEQRRAPLWPGLPILKINHTHACAHAHAHTQTHTHSNSFSNFGGATQNQTKRKKTERPKSGAHPVHLS